jgi:hypothetical protein
MMALLNTQNPYSASENSAHLEGLPLNNLAGFGTLIGPGCYDATIAPCIDGWILQW